jgi:hypothetical protein
VSGVEQWNIALRQSCDSSATIRIRIGTGPSETVVATPPCTGSSVEWLVSSPWSHLRASYSAGGGGAHLTSSLWRDDTLDTLQGMTNRLTFSCCQGKGATS